MRIGYRHRRRGIIDKILIEKRAETARMLAAPLLLPRRPPRGRVIDALTGPEGSPVRTIAGLGLGQIGPRPTLTGGTAPPSIARFVEVARRRAMDGVAAIAVATDGAFLRGSYAALAACRDALAGALGEERRPPILGVDFIIHPIQLDRAVDAGADAVIVIARLLAADALGPLLCEADRRGLLPIVEVASGEEVERALQAGARLLGASSRDLDTGREAPHHPAVVLSAAAGRAFLIDLSPTATRAPDTVPPFPPISAKLLAVPDAEDPAPDKTAPSSTPIDA